MELLKTHFVDGQVLTSDNLNDYVSKLNEIIKAYSECLNDASIAVYNTTIAMNDASIAAADASTSRQYIETIQGMIDSISSGDSELNSEAIEALTSLKNEWLEEIKEDHTYFQETMLPEMEYLEERFTDLDQRVSDKLDYFAKCVDDQANLYTYDEYRAVSPKTMRFYFVAKDETTKKKNQLWRIYIKNMLFAENTNTGLNLGSKFVIKFPFKFA